MKSTKRVSALLATLVLALLAFLPIPTVAHPLNDYGHCDVGYPTATILEMSGCLPELSAFGLAEEQKVIFDEIEGLIAFMMSNSEVTGITFDGRLALGTRLSAYRFEYRLETIADIHWYPVLENGAIVALISLHGDSQMPTITLRDDFASRLNSVLETYYSPFALLFAGENLYVVTPSERVFLRDYPGNSVSNSPCNARLVNEVVEMQFSEVTILRELSPTLRSVQSRQHRNLNVAFVPQGNFNLCWAASVASVGRFHTGTVRTAQQVANAVGIPFNAGATASQTRNALQSVFSVNRTVFGVPTTGNFSAAIMDGRPVIAGFAPPVGMGHMVVIHSFTIDGSGWRFGYMDPNFGFATIFHSNPNRPISITSGGMVMDVVIHIR